MTTTLSRPGKGTTVLKEGWFYGGTFLRGEYGDAHRHPDQRSPKCMLFVRRVQLRRGPSGAVRTVIDRDAIEFADEAAMLAWIEEHAAEELPPEADGDPQFVPEGFAKSDESAP